jgi:hypothetical protein
VLVYTAAKDLNQYAMPLGFVESFAYNLDGNL